MDDNGENLTPEEEALKAQFALEDDDPNVVGIEDELPPLPPFPVGQGVVATFISKKP